MTSWVITIDKGMPDHWERAKISGFWDLPRRRRIVRGDLLYFWLSGTGMIGLAKAMTDTFDYSRKDGPWRDATSGRYRQRVFINPLDSLVRRSASWTEIKIAAGLTNELNSAPVAVSSESGQSFMRALFLDVPPPDVKLPDGLHVVVDVDWHDDLRQRELREISLRQGQAEFRAALMHAYGEECAITGTADVPVLEAAHLSPYRGQHTHQTKNGILLRRDIHRLLDMWLLTVTPDFIVHVSPEMVTPEYRALSGKRVAIPPAAADQPDNRLLSAHNDLCPWLGASRKARVLRAN